MRRYQRSRRGDREPVPVNAVYVGRPTQWGNPFKIGTDWLMWTGVAMGYRGDRNGQRAAAVALYRWWLTDFPKGPLPRNPRTEPAKWEIEYTSGQIATNEQIVSGFAAMAASLLPEPGITLPPKPDLEPLRGKDLVCWCDLAGPCHADVLLDLANR